MKLLICSFLIVLSYFKSYSQELNAEVTVNYNLVNQTSNQVFEDFERSVYQFLNSTRFSDESYNSIQKIDCNFIITIINYTTYLFVTKL